MVFLPAMAKGKGSGNTAVWQGLHVWRSVQLHFGLVAVHVDLMWVHPMDVQWV